VNTELASISVAGVPRVRSYIRGVPLQRERHNHVSSFQTLWGRERETEENSTLVKLEGIPRRFIQLRIVTS